MPTAGQHVEHHTSEATWLRVFLKIVAGFLALCVVLALLQVIDFALRDDLSALIRSGLLGVSTIVGWLLILIGGPYASVQLWRLRRSGLYASATLSGLGFVYYVVGIIFLRAHNAPFRPVIAYVIFNGVLAALLASPAARRSCA
jgi:hypothetical protein